MPPSTIEIHRIDQIGNVRYGGLASAGRDDGALIAGYCFAVGYSAAIAYPQASLGTRAAMREQSRQRFGKPHAGVDQEPNRRSQVCTLLGLLHKSLQIHGPGAYHAIL